MKNTANTYGSVAKILHWLIGFAVIGMLILGTSLEYIKDEALAGKMYMLHKSFGICVLALMLLRILWRVINVAPKPPNHVKHWQQNAEKLVHFVLYFCLIVMPLSGWIMSTASGHIPNIFNYIIFPMPFIPESKALANAASWTHTITGWTLIVLISLHILATIQHYVVHKDNILKRML